MKAKRTPNLSPVQITMSHTEHAELLEDCKSILGYMQRYRYSHNQPYIFRGTIRRLVNTLETV